jgi:hypothetical protein
MSYSAAMEAAGAVILAGRTFGSYQGDWINLIHYEGGLRAVIGSYGSCSGCDSFEAEFESTYHHPTDEDGEEDYEQIGHSLGTVVDGCAKCAETQARLVAFGKSYCDAGLVSAAELDVEIAKHAKASEWDDESSEVAVFEAQLRPVMAFAETHGIVATATAKLWAALDHKRLDVVVISQGGSLVVADVNAPDYAVHRMADDSDAEIAEAVAFLTRAR